MDLDPSDPSDWSLSDTDARVLSFLDDEELTHFTFEGLKRRLNVIRKRSRVVLVASKSSVR
jgi:hypothetical protein